MTTSHSTDQPTTERPTPDQPTPDQPTTDQATTDQATTDQATTDQPTTDQAATERPAQESQPTLSGRDIGIAYFALSGVRDAMLGDVGLTFEDSLLLGALAGGGSATRDDLVEVLIRGLKIAPATASRHIDRLIAAGFAVEDGGTVTSTPAGSEANGRFTARVTQNAPKLYGDIPDEDLAVTQRVLATVTERANRQLALTLGP